MEELLKVTYIKDYYIQKINKTQLYLLGLKLLIAECCMIQGIISRSVNSSKREENKSETNNLQLAENKK